MDWPGDPPAAHSETREISCAVPESLADDALFASVLVTGGEEEEEDQTVSEQHSVASTPEQAAVPAALSDPAPRDDREARLVACTTAARRAVDGAAAQTKSYVSRGLQAIAAGGPRGLNMIQDVAASIEEANRNMSQVADTLGSIHRGLASGAQARVQRVPDATARG